MHSCPYCGQACYCSGDIEDHDVGPEFDEVCTCCPDQGFDDEDDDENWPDSNEDRGADLEP